MLDYTVLIFRFFASLIRFLELFNNAIVFDRLSNSKKKTGKRSEKPKNQ